MTSGIGSPGRSLFHRVRALTIGRAVDRWSSHAALVSATQGFGLLVKGASSVSQLIGRHSDPAPGSITSRANGPMIHLHKELGSVADLVAGVVGGVGVSFGEMAGGCW